MIGILQDGPQGVLVGQAGPRRGRPWISSEVQPPKTARRQTTRTCDACCPSSPSGPSSGPSPSIAPHTLS